MPVNYFNAVIPANYLGGCIDAYSCPNCKHKYVCDSSKAETTEGDTTYVCGPCCCMKTKLRNGGCIKCEHTLPKQGQLFDDGEQC